jgi:hypothetical protein
MMIVAQVKFQEWTPDSHLRHAIFVGLRNDKDALNVIANSIHHHLSLSSIQCLARSTNRVSAEAGELNRPETSDIGCR